MNNVSSKKRLLCELSKESFFMPEGVVIDGSSADGKMMIYQDNKYLKDYGILITPDGIAVNNNGTEKLYRKDDIVQLFVDSYTVGVETLKNRHYHIVSGNYIAEKPSNPCFIKGKPEKIYRLSIIIHNGYGKRETVVLLDYFNMDAQENSTFIFDNTFPAMYFFRYIEQEAERILDIDDEIVEGEELAGFKRHRIPDKKPSFVNFIDNGSKKEIQTNIPASFIMQFSFFALLCIAAIYGLFTLHFSDSRFFFAVLLVALCSFLFAYINATSKCAYSICVKGSEAFISKRNLIGQSELVFSGSYYDLVRICPFEFQSQKRYIHLSGFHIKILMLYDDVSDSISLLQETGLTVEQAEYLTEQMKKFLEF